MKRISYEVVENKRGAFDAVKWVEWPGRDQRVYPPESYRLNTYPTREAAAKACQYDADWQHIVDADAGRHSEIVCEVAPADKFELADEDAEERRYIDNHLMLSRPAEQPADKFVERDESPLVKPRGKCETVDGWDI